MERAQRVSLSAKTGSHLQEQRGSNLLARTALDGKFGGDLAVKKLQLPLVIVSKIANLGNLGGKLGSFRVGQVRRRSHDGVIRQRGRRFGKAGWQLHAILI